MEGMVIFNKLNVGKWGEQTATHFLVRHGYTIVARNFACTFGEIDIIARKNKLISFVEVKTRCGWVGSAERSVDWAKQRHMLRAAQQFCQKNKMHFWDTEIIFEQISIYYDSDQKQARIIKYVLPS
jgi:putative endonuclease